MKSSVLRIFSFLSILVMSFAEDTHTKPNISNVGINDQIISSQRDEILTL